MRGFRIRLVLYPVLIISVVTLAALTLNLCLRAGEVPSFILDSRIVAWLANRVGIEYSIESARVGCFQPECRIEVDASGLEVALPEVSPLRFKVGSVHWCPVHPISIQNLTVSGPTPAQVFIGDIEFSAQTRSAEFRDVRVARTSGSPVTIQRVSSSPVTLIPGERRLSLERIDLSGIHADAGENGG